MSKYVSLYKKGGYEEEWKDILYLEDKIINMMIDIYNIKLYGRIILEGSYGIKIYIKYNSMNYEIVISKRKEDIGFSIYNVDTSTNYEYVDKTFKNDKMCLYHIYKLIYQMIN
jgi:hypothetical protein